MSLFGSRPSSPVEPDMSASSLTMEPGRPAGLELYENSQIYLPGKNFPVRIAADLGQLGLFHAANMIANLQMWQNRLPAGQDVNFVFATGKTQLMGIAELARIRNEWTDLSAGDQRVLRSFGVDLNKARAFDSERIKAFHLDTFLPQSRDAIHSYAYQVNRFADLLGISGDKRFLFYGDIDLWQGESRDEVYGYRALNPDMNRMGEQKFRALQCSVNLEGLLIDRYKQGNLKGDHIQAKFFSDLELYVRLYIKFISENGGPHIINASVGSSYKGEGHVGFGEAEHLSPLRSKWMDQSFILAPASYPALAGNIKANGGMHRAFNHNGDSVLGMLTLGPADLRINPEVCVNLVINGSAKSSTVKAFCENASSGKYPVTSLRGLGRGSTLIVDESAFRDSAYARIPSLFSEVQFENEVAVNGLIISLIRAYNRKYPSNPLNLYEVTLGKLNELAGYADSFQCFEKPAIFGGNLERAFSSSSRSFSTATTNLRNTFENSLCDWDSFPDKLGVKQGDTVFQISPHLDDVPLAFGAGINSLAVAGVQQKIVTATPGDSAVSNEYVRKVIGVFQEHPEALAAINVLSPEDSVELEKDLLRELTQFLEKSTAQFNTDSKNYNYWDSLKTEEQVLRAKLALLALNRLRVENDLKPLSDLSEINALHELMLSYSGAVPAWSAGSELKIVRDLKTAVRITEDQTCFLSQGVAYEDYAVPFNPSWYTGGVDRETTLSRSDIDAMKAKLNQHQPKVIVVNGEGFMDHEAHCLTEMTVRIALGELIEAGELWDCKVLFYQGVWDRTEVSGDPDQILVALNSQDMTVLKGMFQKHYRSQVPALVPDGGCPNKFFSDRVAENASITMKDLQQFFGNSSPDLLRQAAGVLAFDVVDLSVSNGTSRASFLEKTRESNAELDRVKPAIERGAFGKIVAPSSHVALKADQAILLSDTFERSGLKSSDLLTEAEIKKLGI